MCIYYTGYVTTNQVNGKKYIGVHQTQNIDDNYLGSGTLLLRAIDKYGPNNFIKEIIDTFDTRHQMLLWETIMVTKDIVNDPLYYNIALGGHGGREKGFKHSDESLAKMRAHHAGGKTKGHKASEETKQKLRDSHLGKILLPESVAKRQATRISKGIFGHPHTLESKQKLSKANKGKPWTTARRNAYLKIINS